MLPHEKYVFQRSLQHHYDTFYPGKRPFSILKKGDGNGASALSVPSSAACADVINKKSSQFTRIEEEGEEGKISSKKGPTVGEGS